jgi:TetR/AcrR family transcriptional regulator
MSDSGKLRRERDAEVARRAILDAAEEIFAQEGFDGARIDAIAEASGYNKSLIFHYFEDKLGLYRAIVLRMKETVYAGLAPMLAPFLTDDTTPLSAGQVRTVFETAIRWYFNYLVEHPRILRILAWEAAECWCTFNSIFPTPDGVQRSLKHLETYISFIRRAQAAGLIAPELDPSFLLINMTDMCIMYLLSIPRYSLVYGEAIQTSPEKLASTREQIIKLLLDGILAR